MCPNIGDLIYVPSIEADESSSCGWCQQKKKGGYAMVSNWQKVADGKHLVFVIEYGGYGMWWEDFLAPKQEELQKQYGNQTRAQMLLR